MLNKMTTDLEIHDFLYESNLIENENSDIAYADAILAWKYVMSIDILSEKDILKIHELSMKNIRPDIAGNYRTCNVYIGGQLKVYRGLEFIKSQISDFINLMTSSYKLETIEEKEMACKKAHVLFENQHPFEDGNGRVGRIIYNWHRLKLGRPLHIIHVGEEQQAYMMWFSNNINNGKDTE